jgi:hypothetical protein
MRSGGIVPRWLRRLRYGTPVIVVSGLPRSGTSMMMRMLAAGGIAIVADGVRRPDDSNPQGYFEFEPVKSLDQPGADRTWLGDARGKAVKIISFLVTWLPEDANYDVIVMERDLDEVLASQQQMLIRRGTAGDGGETPRARETLTAHLAQLDRFLSRRTCFRSLRVSHRETIDDPAGSAARVARFLGRRLDVAAMAAAVDRELYRNRAGTASPRA